MSLSIPLYDELPVFEKTGEHHAWQVFGEHDELGTMNFIGSRQVMDGIRCATSGRVVSLALPLNLPSPALSANRDGYTHHISRTRSGSDDRLDNFYPQCSSQWDALSHIRYREFGYYGGRQEADLDHGALGIDVLARKGMIGRGVLVDFAGYRDAIKDPVDPHSAYPITPDDLDSCLAWAGCSVQQGDILLLRTGWMRWYLAQGETGRASVAGRLHNRADGMDCPGLAPGRDMAAWLWNHRIAAVAADNASLEVLRISKERGFLHHRILALLGMPIGEFWQLEELAAACQERGRSSFLLASTPLNLPRGVGSPCNACAIL